MTRWWGIRHVRWLWLWRRCVQGRGPYRAAGLRAEDEHLEAVWEGKA